MKTVKSELITLVTRAAKTFAIPVIRQVYMPEPQPSPDRDSEFGVIALEDGSAGLYYAWMGKSQAGMNQRYATEEFAGLHPLELIQYYKSDHEADRSLGLAAVNAISQCVFRQAKYDLPEAGNSMGELDVKPGDHIGMVGYFPSLVRQLKARNIRVTVIEKKQHLVQADQLIKVTLETRALRHCNKVISTASTLLNDSIDEILGYAGEAEIIVVVGPTAGFIPDPLFKRGVKATGGLEILDTDLAISRLSRQQRPGDAARKYVIKRNHYPGAATLLPKL